MEKIKTNNDLASDKTLFASIKNLRADESAGISKFAKIEYVEPAGDKSENVFVGTLRKTIADNFDTFKIYAFFSEKSAKKANALRSYNKILKTHKTHLGADRIIEHEINTGTASVIYSVLALNSSNLSFFLEKLLYTKYMDFIYFVKKDKRTFSINSKNTLENLLGVSSEKNGQTVRNDLKNAMLLVKDGRQLMTLGYGGNDELFLNSFVLKTEEAFFRKQIEAAAGLR